MLLLFLQLLSLICISTRASLMLYPEDGDTLTLCDNEALSVTCITDNGRLIWSLDSTFKTFVQNIHPVGSFADLSETATVILVRSSVDQLTSVATFVDIVNGTTVSCKDTGDESAPVKSKTFLIAGLPSKPTNVNFKAINFTSATIHWMPPVDNSNCIVYYVVYLETDDTALNFTIASTSLLIKSLETEEYLVKVAAVDQMGRVGENASILMIFTVPQSVKDLIVQTCDATLFVSWKRPPSSFYLPVTHYTVQHNVTTSGRFVQENTTLTRMNISNAQTGRLYYIEIIAVNVLGSGPSVNVSLMRTVATVDNLSTTPTVIEQMQTTCSCAVELGVSILICFLLMVAGCFLTAFIIIKKHMFVQLYTILWQRCKEKFFTFSSNEDPSMMNPNIAYEEQEPGYTETFHKYHNTNPTLVRVDCHVYDQPSKLMKDNNNCK